MDTGEQLRVEPLRGHPAICVLRDEQGKELGTGSREVLEVLLYIAERYNYERMPRACPVESHARR